MGSKVQGDEPVVTATPAGRADCDVGLWGTNAACAPRIAGVVASTALESRTPAVAR